MADTTVQISFGADVSAVTSGTQQVSAAIQSIGPALTGVGASLAQFGAAVTKAFARPDVSGLTAAISQAGAGSAQFVGAMSQAGGAIQKWAAQAAAAGQQSGQLAQSFLAGKAPIDSVGVSFTEYGGRAQQAAAAGATLSVSFQASQSSIVALNGVLQGAATAIAPVIQAATGLASSWGQFLQQATPVGAALSSVSSAAQSVSGVFSDISSAIAAASGVFASLDEALQSVGDLFYGVGTAVDGVNDTVGSFNGVLQSLNGLFQDAKGALDGAQVSMVAFNAAADANPVGLLVQVIQTLVGWAMKVVDWLKQIGALGDAWNAIKAGADLFWQTLKIVWDWLGIAKTAIVDLLTGHWSFDNLRDGFQNLSKDIKQTQADAQDLARSIASIAGKAFGQSASDPGVAAGAAPAVAPRSGGAQQQAPHSASPPSAPPPPAAQATSQCPQDKCVEQTAQDSQKATQATLKGIEDRTKAQQKAADDDYQIEKIGFSERASLINQEEQSGVISAKQAHEQRLALIADETQAERAHLKDVETIDLQGLTDKQGQYAKDSEAWKALDQQKADVETKFAAEIKLAAAKESQDYFNEWLKSIQQFQQQFHSFVDPIVGGFTSGLEQMIEGTKSFAQVFRGIGQQILDDFIKNVVDKKIESWLAGEAEQTGASNAQSLIRRAIQSIEALFGVTITNADTALHQTAEAAKTGATLTAVAVRTTATTGGATAELAVTGAAAIASIGTSAAKAAAATWAGVAQAFGPLGPFLAPVLAGAALAAVLDYKGLVHSAAGGFDIPAGLNPVTQLHAQEMVLPARLANPMRDMLANFSSGQASGASSGGGDTHNHTHNWSVTAMDGPSVEKFLRTHGDRMVKVLNERARANAGVALGYAR